MEVGPQIWGGEGGGRGRMHSQSSSNIQPPWEIDSLAAGSVLPLGNHLPDAVSPSQQSSSSNAGLSGYGGVSYLDNSSLPPSPLENLYRRTASFSHSSRSLSTSPAHLEASPGSSGAQLLHRTRSSAALGNSADGMRRQSLSGPLPSQDGHHPPAAYRRPSLSGPLPNSSHNPYGSAPHEAESTGPLEISSTWRDSRLNGTPATTNGGVSNRFLHNPFSPDASLSVSSSSSSPSSVARPASHPCSNGGDSNPSIASPSSVGNGYSGGENGGGHADTSPWSSRGPPVRQLYGYANATTSGSFATVVGPALCQPVSPSFLSGGEQWASFPVNGSQGSNPNGRALANVMSQMTHGPASASGGHSPRDSSKDGGREDLGRGGRRYPRSRTLQNGDTQGGAVPANSQATLSRNVSCNGTEELVRKYSKGRGGLGEGVLETLVAQLVFAKDKPSMLPDMIFSKAKLSSPSLGNSKSSFAHARDLVERVLLAQVHALTPSFKNIAQKSLEFEEATWALEQFKNGKVKERFPNEGYRLLRLQTQFVEAGLEAFDMLCRVRKQFPSLMLADEQQRRPGDGGEAGLVRTACFGGGPGCEALAIRLFFMRLLPHHLQMQVDVFDRRERWTEIVTNISLKGVGFLPADVFDAVSHPTLLRSYRLFVFLDTLGRGMKASTARRKWDEFWSNLYQNTGPGVVLIILEKSCTWDEMKPQKGSKWWFSPLQDFVHVAPKL